MIDGHYLYVSTDSINVSIASGSSAVHFEKLLVEEVVDGAGDGDTGRGVHAEPLTEPCDVSKDSMI